MVRILYVFLSLIVVILEGNRITLPKWVRKSISSTVLSIGLVANIQSPAYAQTSWDDRSRLASEVWRKVDELYFDRTFNGQNWFQLRQEVVKRTYKSDSELYSALQQMISKLGDKYTKYLTPAQYSALLSSSQAELVGLGVELGTDETGCPVVLRVEDGSPAQLIGLQSGDKIINVEGQDASSLSPEEVAALLRGKVNTKASLRVQRSSQTIDVSAERQPIKLKGVSSAIDTLSSGSKVGIVRIRSFSTSTLDEVTHAMESLHSQGTMSAIVIDLRDNGGGVLQGAVDTSNLFVPPGKIIVFTVGKDGLTEAKQTLANVLVSVDTELPDLTTPMYILINKNTASAAEVFSAALQELGRAKLVGEKSFGKGIIQTLTEVQQGGLAVTIARYETPLHHNINKIGINPDISIPTCTESFEKVASVCLEKVIK